MTEFLTPLATKWMSPGWYRVEDDWHVRCGQVGCLVTVPRGFEFDGDSVPRIPGVYAFAKGRAEKAACLHDYLYRYQQACGRRITRKDADRAMLDAMVAEGVAWHHRWPIYMAVRAGGRRSWRRYRNQ